MSAYRPRYSAHDRQRRTVLQFVTALVLHLWSAHKPSWKTRGYAVTVLAIALIMHTMWTDHTAAVAASLRQEQQQQQAAMHQRIVTFSSQLSAIMAANPQVTYSVAVIGSESGAHTYGSNAVFDGASTGKLLTTADYLHQVEQGKVSLQQQIGGESGQQLIRAMLVNSDDNAWLAMNDYLGHDSLTAYAQSIGFADYAAANNTFTAADVANLLNQIYLHHLLNAADRSLVLGYMKQANYRQYIVPAIPAADTVYHKVGLDNDTVNDAAIITQGNQSFELVIFTDGNGTYDWPDRALSIQQITKDALAAFLP